MTHLQRFSIRSRAPARTGRLLMPLLALLALGSTAVSCGGGSGGSLDLGGDLSVDVARAYPALAFDQPVALLQAPGDDTHWHVVEQGGTIRRFADDPAVQAAGVVLDLGDRVVSGGEQGLLGMAFAPDFAATGRIYLSYTRPGPSAGRPVSVISRWLSTDGGETIDADSEVVLLEILQEAANHNGGHIVFGPDGLLYAGLGDGGGANDPAGHGQDVSTLFGSIIRVDVGGEGYAIPAGNPFAGLPPCADGFSPFGEACPEIWAFGLRNPWRFSFDAANGSLWVADVGQGDFEEVNLVQGGGNYGWPEREGAHCNPNLFPDGNCSSSGFAEPVAEYGHDLGRSVTGGFVYRGSDISPLRGHYVFGDYISGRLFSVPAASSATVGPRVLLESGLRISSFAEDADGELLVVDHRGGIYRLVESD